MYLKIKKIKKKYFGTKDELIINTTFGPINFIKRIQLYFI